MNIGIDLGTTYSCAAYVDRNGIPRIIGGEGHRKTTPSAVMTDGERAWVGREALRRKRISIYGVRELFKRDMGRPAEIPHHLREKAEREGLEVRPYEAGGFCFGAEGISALVLCELKRQALAHPDFSVKGGAGEVSVLNAVITVPAYFGDAARQATQLAGEAAGLRILGLINEPTAAALAYGADHRSDSRVMVFDFGGGTIDITVLEVDATGDVRVLSSGGHQRLGGTEVDEIILEYLESRFEARHGRALSDESASEILELAVDAKHRLSEADEVPVQIRVPEGDLEIMLYRSRSAAAGAPSDAFFLEERLTDILQQCRVLSRVVLGKAGISHTWGETRSMEWGDLDRVLLVGGSSKIPVVKRSLEEWSDGVEVRLGEGAFHPDTAVAVGAALYAERRDRVRDVLSKSVGVKLVDERGDDFIDHILHKNAPLPAQEERTYPAARGAILEIYEGESTSPDECSYRGGMTLDNWAGDVTIRLAASIAGILTATADYPPEGMREIPIHSKLFEFYGERVARLKEKVASIQINPTVRAAAS